MAQQAARGPTMDKSENTLKDLSKRQKDNVKHMLQNFLEIIKLIKVEEERGAPVRVQMAEQEQLEMAVRAANVARCAENLLSLSEDLRKLIFLNDFPYISQTVQKARESSQADAVEAQKRLNFVYREMQNELVDLEEEYGSTWYLKPQDALQPDDDVNRLA